MGIGGNYLNILHFVKCICKVSFRFQNSGAEKRNIWSCRSYLYKCLAVVSIMLPTLLEAYAPFGTCILWMLACIRKPYIMITKFSFQFYPFCVLKRAIGYLNVTGDKRGNIGKWGRDILSSIARQLKHI